MAAPSFAQLFGHLEDVEKSTTSGQQQQPFDIHLLEDCRRLFTSGAPQEEIHRFVLISNRILVILQQDPAPLTILIERALPFVPFEKIRHEVPLKNLEQGLQSPSNAVQSVALAYIRKAADSPSGAAEVASNADLVKLLITLWLSTNNTEIAEKAVTVICKLLEVDSPTRSTLVHENTVTGYASGQDLLWRRIFRDKETYSLLQDWTSLRSGSGATTKRQATLAQGRLFDFVVKVCEMRWDIISPPPMTTSSVPLSPMKHMRQQSSLLEYVTVGMIDDDDLLIVPVRLDFFGNLLKITEYQQCSTPVSKDSSPALDFLIGQGKHEQALSYFLKNEEDPLAVRLLGGAHVRYLEAYLEHYPDHFMNAELPPKLRDALNELQIEGPLNGGGLSL